MLARGVGSGLLRKEKAAQQQENKE